MVFSGKNRSGERATLRMGLGQRQLSRISLVFIIIISLGIAWAGYSVYRGFKTQRDLVYTRENMIALYKAMRAYALDHESKLPPAANWSDCVAGYLTAALDRPGGKMASLHGTSDMGAVGYVYNDYASHYNFDPPASFLPGHQQAAAETPADQLILLIEKVGAPLNAHEPIPGMDSDQDRQQLAKMLQFPHGSGKPADAETMILYADGHIETDMRKDFQN